MLREVAKPDDILENQLILLEDLSDFISIFP